MLVTTSFRFSDVWLDHLAAREGQELTRQPGGPLGGELDLLDVVT